MKPKRSLLILTILMLGFSAGGYAQLGMFSRQQLIEFTPGWHGAGIPDGRPDIPDSVLARLKGATAEQV